MSFLDKIAKKLHIPAFFIIIMKRMSLTSQCALTALHGDNLREILEDFTNVVQTIGRNPGDSDHKTVMDHIYESVNVRDAERYVRPVGIKMMIMGNFCTTLHPILINNL